MNELSKQLGALLSGLFDIPEFFDQRLTDALLEFHAWLGYRAECIESQKNRLVQPSTTCQYISQVMKEMTEYVSKVAAALSDFVKGGVGPIRETQEKSQTRLQNMSTVYSTMSKERQANSLAFFAAILTDT
ncbi:hypothetical protein FRC04_011546 [Tulasnella sp. 424]|nr:hypothetical protein FRC04_011546 [Tulasnella sp. 424]